MARSTNPVPFRRNRRGSASYPLYEADASAAAEKRELIQEIHRSLSHGQVDPEQQQVSMALLRHLVRIDS